MSDLVLELPVSLAQGDARGPWRIVEPLEKLKEKYGEESGVFNSVEFDRYAAARAEEDPDWLDRLEGADIAVTRLMSSNVTSSDVKSLLDHREAIEAALRQVTRDGRLDARDEPDWSACRVVFSAMEMHNIGLAKMTKVLCMKRPRLIPMLDSYVMELLFSKSWPSVSPDTYAEAGVAGMKQFRSLMRHAQNLGVLREITARINEWLRDQGRHPPVLSEVRVLDNLLWFDRRGFESFSGWRNTATDIRRA